MECSNCGAENKLLFKTISKNGIIKVCNQCLGKLKSPIINDSSRVDFEKPEVKLTVGERLARLAGVKLEKRRIEPIKPEQNNKLKRPVEVPRELSFDSSSAKTLTISNLQEIKKQKEARILKENEEKNYSVSPSFVEGINKVENYDYLNESIVLDEKLENKETSAKYFDSKGKEIALSTPKRIERELIKPKKDLSPQEIREMIFGKNR